MMKKAFFNFLLILFSILVLIELGLRLSGYFYLKTHQIDNPQVAKNDSLRIMFIGDSWTFGSDAPKGEGYVDIFQTLLKQNFTQKTIQVFNYAYPSSNSSQCILQFLDNYQNIKPHIVIVLFGINNGWNTQDVIITRKKLDHLFNYNDTKTTFSTLGQKILNLFNKFRLVKLGKIFYYNLIIKPKEIKFPFSKFNSSYTKEFFDIFGISGPDLARKFLLDNYKKIENYDEFFNLILYSFANNFENTKSFLIEKNFWHPELIKTKFNYGVHNKLISERLRILEEDIEILNQLCNYNKIYFIIQTYPFLMDYIGEVNNCIIAAALKFNISCVGQFEAFRKNFTSDKWQQIMTRYHLNEKGHYYMAENLFEFVKYIIR